MVQGMKSRCCLRTSIHSSVLYVIECQSLFSSTRSLSTKRIKKDAIIRVHGSFRYVSGSSSNLFYASHFAVLLSQTPTHHRSNNETFMDGFVTQTFSPTSLLDKSMMLSDSAQRWLRDAESAASRYSQRSSDDIMNHVCTMVSGEPRQGNKDKQGASICRLS